MPYDGHYSKSELNLNPSFCSMLGTCGGCAWGYRELTDQRSAKLAEVAGLGVPAHFADTPGLRLRDRADLVWQKFETADGFEMRLGLYGLNERVIVDLPECPMMSTRLEAFFLEFRAKAPPIGKGSVRLRVAPDGRRGAWLDFANQDVKHLFEERSYLRWLSDLGSVEIGQRRKRLVWKDDAPKLVDPVADAWFETYDAAGVGIPLFGPIGGFSQSGFVGNRALVDEVASAAARAGVDRWLELFGGNGNFALALAARGASVEVVEVDELAVTGLRRSLDGRGDLDVKVHRLDAYLKTATLPSVDGRGVVVDPPRAGLRQTLEWIEREKPPAIVYVSCFTDVFTADAARLTAMGYRMESLVGVDQFAQSPHAEWVALFKF